MFNRTGCIATGKTRRGKRWISTWIATNNGIACEKLPVYESANCRIIVHETVHSFENGITYAWHKPVRKLYYRTVVTLPEEPYSLSAIRAIDCLLTDR